MGYLKNWCEKYEVDRDMLTYRCEDLGEKYLGMTSYRHVENLRFADIRINEVLKNYPLTRMAVSWHEFCHAEKFIKTDTTDGHGSEWRGRMWRQPFLAIYDIVATKIVFEIAKRHN